MKSVTKIQTATQKEIFGRQLLKRIKQKGFWDYKKDKADLEKLYCLLFPENAKLLDKEKPSNNSDALRRIVKWTTGETLPKPPEIKKLCDILECDTTYFFTENAEMPNRDIEYLCQTYNINRESSENLLAITKDKAAVEMLNIILGNREILLDFLQNLYDIKNNRDIDKRIMISKNNSESIIIDLEEIEKETGETIPLKYGISIKDAIKGNALNNINRIIDQWTERKDGD